MIYTRAEVIPLFLSKAHIDEDWPKEWKFSYSDFVTIIVKPEYSLAKELGLRCAYVSKCLDVFWPDRLKAGSSKISTHILKINNYKYCPKCNLCKDLHLFGISSYNSTGVSLHCRQCSSARSQAFRDCNPELSKEHSRNNYYSHKDSYIQRNISKKLHTKLATPSWANLDIIKRVYDCAEGDHVDHIIPLQGELVCGLHVENNLQYLSPEENMRKSNKFIVV